MQQDHEEIQILALTESEAHYIVLESVKCPPVVVNIYPHPTQLLNLS